MEKLERLAADLSRLLDRAAGLCMVAIMALVCINVIVRAVFSEPILGTYDLVSFLTAGVIGLSIAYCAVKDGHIAVGIVVDKLPSKGQAVVDMVVNFAAAIFWGLAAWQLVRYAAGLAENNVVTSTIKLPVNLIVYIIALGIAVMGLVLFVKFLEAAKKVVYDK